MDAGSTTMKKLQVVRPVRSGWRPVTGKVGESCCTGGSTTRQRTVIDPPRWCRGIAANEKSGGGLLQAIRWGGFPFPLSMRPPLLLLVPLAPKGTEGVACILSTMCAATVVTVLNTRTSTGSTSETFLTLDRGATKKESPTGSACTR